MRDSLGRFRNSALQIYQVQLRDQLKSIFLNEEVQEEWSSMRDEYGLSVYSPRLDIAVGPFATHERLGHEYDSILRRPIVEEFLRILVEYNRINLEAFDNFVRPPEYEDILYMNHNARCFMAIEIEHLVSRKHLIGGAINASALGRFGVVIPWSDEKLRAFIKLVRYLHYLRFAEKNTFNTTNLLIITKEQMDTALQDLKIRHMEYS
ncbi:hypothetical protein [Brevibacillus formosus]|uniref:hypothetical protein n=2 Tax=Brevibacillus formosus TaxID=54913 RepID=UPI003F5343A5